MKKINYKNYIAATALLGLMTSCKKSFLDRPPADQIVDANFYQTDDQVLAGTAPLYNIVWFAYNDKASHGIGDGRGGVLMSGSYEKENINMQTVGSTGEVLSSWSSFFNIVGQANNTINNISQFAGPGVSSVVKNAAIAEGRFIRGLAYSYLVQNWGPVPIITNNSTLLTDTSIRRNTVETIWEFITRDIRFGVDNLPAAPLQKGRLSKYSAEGMLAKMYLTRAGVGQTGSRDQKYLDSAAYYAKDVIDHSGAALMTNYEDLFMMKNNNNSESLFSLQWKYDGPWGVQNSVQAFLAYGSEITGFADGWGGDLGASKDILDKYNPADKRRKATFMFPADHYSYIHQKTSSYYGELNVRVDHHDDGDYNTRAWVKKYVVGRPEDNNGKVTQQHTEINTYMLRLADVYLIYAEAILGNAASTSDVLALQYFNAVRARAGLSSKTSITFDDIFNERHLEFAMEGQAWYDLVRLHYFNPQKALSIISTQDKGTYKVTPNVLTNATSWTITSVTPAYYPVTESNFYLPRPDSENATAPNLRLDPVPYSF